MGWRSGGVATAATGATHNDNGECSAAAFRRVHPYHISQVEERAEPTSVRCRLLELLDLPLVSMVRGPQVAGHARVDLGDRVAGLAALLLAGHVSVHEADAEGRGDGEVREAVAGADHAHQFGNARGVRYDATGTNLSWGA
jgi:hypothetical protein